MSWIQDGKSVLDSGCPGIRTENPSWIKDVLDSVLDLSWILSWTCPGSRTRTNPGWIGHFPFLLLLATPPSVTNYPILSLSQHAKKECLVVATQVAQLSLLRIQQYQQQHWTAPFTTSVHQLPSVRMMIIIWLQSTPRPPPCLLHCCWIVVGLGMVQGLLVGIHVFFELHV